MGVTQIRPRVLPFPRDTHVSEISKTNLYFSYLPYFSPFVFLSTSTGLLVFWVFLAHCYIIIKTYFDPFLFSDVSWPSFFFVRLLLHFLLVIAGTYPGHVSTFSYFFSFTRLLPCFIHCLLAKSHLARLVPGLVTRTCP